MGIVSGAGRRLDRNEPPRRGNDSMAPSAAFGRRARAAKNANPDSCLGPSKLRMDCFREIRCRIPARSEPPTGRRGRYRSRSSPSHSPARRCRREPRIRPPKTRDRCDGEDQGFSAVDSGRRGDRRRRKGDAGGADERSKRGESKQQAIEQAIEQDQLQPPLRHGRRIRHVRTKDAVVIGLIFLVVRIDLLTPIILLGRHHLVQAAQDATAERKHAGARRKIDPTTRNISPITHGNLLYERVEFARPCRSGGWS